VKDLQIVRTQVGGRLRLVGELDMSNADQLADMLAEIGAAGDQVILDMSELTFIDSSGVHVILRYAVSLDGRGPIVLLNPGPTVMKILQIVGADSMPHVQVRAE
jgi:anti-sigma B factor antagonist